MATPVSGLRDRPLKNKPHIYKSHGPDGKWFRAFWQVATEYRWHKRKILSTRVPKAYNFTNRLNKGANPQ